MDGRANVNRPSHTAGDVLTRLELRIGQDLESLPDVLAARLWLLDLRRLREAYIAVSAEASIDEVTEAVHEELRVNGLEFDPDNVRIAPIDAAVPAARTAQSRFLLFDGLEVSRAEGHAICRVRLAGAGDRFQGEATELDTATGRVRAAARAVLDAAEKAVPDIRLGLEGAQIVELFTRDYVVLSVEAAVARHRVLLAGISVVDRSPEDAACLAALSAIDRWIAG